MEASVLIKDIDKYGGKYVATKDFTDKDVVSYGDNPVTVFNDTVKSGIEDPAIFYVPKKDVVHIVLLGVNSFLSRFVMGRVGQWRE